MSLPPDPANLQYLYRADAGTYTDLAGTTAATSDGDSVNLWQDQAGNGCDLGAASGAPLLKLSRVNGMPSLLFAGTEYFRASNTFVSPNRTIYAVLKATSGATMDLACGDQGSLEWRLDSLKPRLVYANIADIGFCTTAISSGTWTQISVSWDGTTGVFRMASAANGSQTYGSPPVAWGPHKLIGNGIGGKFAGEMALVMEFAGVHTTTVKQSVESWITGIWGV